MTYYKALDILIKLEHRGAVSADGRTGDGAGILFDIPHDFFKKVCDFEIPTAKQYAVGMVFMPKKTNAFAKHFEASIKVKIEILGWRVPVDASNLGQIAAEKPTVKQVFVGKNGLDLTEQQFAKMFAARKIAEHAIINSKFQATGSISGFLQQLSYIKGLLMPEDISRYYTDLLDDINWLISLCHNGEINTLRGNISRMRALKLMKSDVLAMTSKLFPILEGKSDSASMDMVMNCY
jgi:glutamate synthase (ferredoxin)